MIFYQSLTNFLIYITLNGIKKNLSNNTILPAGLVCLLEKVLFIFSIMLFLNYFLAALILTNALTVV